MFQTFEWCEVRAPGCGRNRLSIHTQHLDISEGFPIERSRSVNLSAIKLREQPLKLCVKQRCHIISIEEADDVHVRCSARRAWVVILARGNPIGLTLGNKTPKLPGFGSSNCSRDTNTSTVCECIWSV
jgi:hypothetical protein